MQLKICALASDPAEREARKRLKHSSLAIGHRFGKFNLLAGKGPIRPCMSRVPGLEKPLQIKAPSSQSYHFDYFRRLEE
jgi:hypothetical protein